MTTGVQAIAARLIHRPRRSAGRCRAFPRFAGRSRKARSRCGSAILRGGRLAGTAEPNWPLMEQHVMGSRSGNRSSANARPGEPTGGRRRSSKRMAKAVACGRNIALLTRVARRHQHRSRSGGRKNLGVFKADGGGRLKNQSLLMHCAFCLPVATMHSGQLLLLMPKPERAWV